MKMLLFQSTIAVFYVILFVLSLCTFTFAAPAVITGVTDVAKVNSSYPYYLILELLQLADKDYIDRGRKKNRVKRGDPKPGGFSTLAEMPPSKIFRMVVTLIFNPLLRNPVGPPHPLHRSAPGPAMAWFKKVIQEGS